MKGLFLKDTYLIRKSCKMVFLLDAVFLVAYLFSEEKPLFFVGYPCVTTMVIPHLLLTYEEAENWYRYAATLPYTKNQILSSKYLIAVLYGFFVLILSAAVQACSMLKDGSFDPENYFLIFILLAAMCLIPCAIILPILYRFGTAKGRLVYSMIIGVICALSFFMTDVLEKIPAGWNNMQLAVTIGIITAVLFAGSWLLSVHFCKKREL